MLSHFSCVQLFATLWTVACLALLPVGFSRQEYWSGLPCFPPGDLLIPGIEPRFLISPALAGGLLTTGATQEAPRLSTPSLSSVLGWLSEVLHPVGNLGIFYSPGILGLFPPRSDKKKPQPVIGPARPQACPSDFHPGMLLLSLPVLWISLPRQTEYLQWFWHSSMYSHRDFISLLFWKSSKNLLL